MKDKSPQTQITPLDQLLLGLHKENLCGAGTEIVRVELPRDFFVRGPSLEAPTLSCFTLLCHSINLSHIRGVGDSALGNPGSSLRDEEAPESECWGGSQRGTRGLTLQRLRSLQLKSRAVCATP